MLARIWSPLSSDLSEFNKRVDFEKEIFAEAKSIAAIISDRKIKELGASLQSWHIIVDLPENRVNAVSIYVLDEGTLDLPNLFFDPARWSQVYDLEKRTGYVFCPPRFIPLVALSAKILLLKKFGYVCSAKADRIAKAAEAIPDAFYDQLRSAGHLDDQQVSLLKREAVSLVSVDSDSFDLPKIWVDSDPKIATKIAAMFKAAMPLGMSKNDADGVVTVVSAVSSYLQKRADQPIWLTHSKIDEVKDLQQDLLDHLRTLQIPAVEGAAMGGGRTDIIVASHILIENKVAGTVAKPHETMPNAAYQANRYSISLCKNIFCTMVAYKPTDENALLRPWDSMRVRTLEIAGTRVTEIRFVVPYGQNVPSRAKKPRTTTVRVSTKRRQQT